MIEFLGIPVLTLSIMIPIVMAPLAYVLGRLASKIYSQIVSHVSLALPFIVSIIFFQHIYAGRSHVEEYRWTVFPTPKQPISLEAGFILDGTSFPFFFLISLVGFLSSLYSSKYMEREARQEIYYSLLMLFVAGMVGVVIVTNLFLFFLFWELMLVPSYFLIAYWGTGKPREIGFKYFVFTHAGSLSLLLGIAWTSAMFGDLNIFRLRDIIEASPASSSELLPIATLMFIGFAVKMAIFPFHTWLPDAHAEAPTPISVLLSGVMIKTGVYAIVRITLGLFSNAFPLMVNVLSYVAVITIVWGGVMALVQVDVKRLLAYSSISQMGYILFGLVSFPHIIGLAGAVFHSLTHGFAKALLFMVSGSLIHEVGERDIRRMGGLASIMPFTATAALLGALSIAGTPPLGGFQSELLIFTGSLASLGIYLVIVAVLATALTAGYYLKMVRSVFFGERIKVKEDIRECPGLMIGPMSVLMFLVVVLGFLHAPILAIIIEGLGSSLS